MAITAGRDRILLATLLLHAGRVVDHATLAEALWGIGPPPTARSQLQICVSRLRRRLPPETIASDPAGYRLTCDPDDLDATAFTRLVTAARAECDADRYREALDLWRGPALAGLDCPPIRAGVAVLDEQYATAVEEWAELEPAAGDERDLIGLLGPVVERFPLRERLRGQLIRALADAGRAADALAEFRRTRDVLVEELGIEPGAELQELHRRVLSATEAAPVRSLPRTVGDFTGRDEVVARLLGELDRPGPAIAAIDGMPGSGKTTLALHLASLVGDRYPDAHLFVDLLGHSAEQPLEPGAALLILLRQLGVPAGAVPAELGDRITLWRSELARRRVLVVLDNAYSSAQLAELLPAVPGSAALVTSRRRLVGLGAYVEAAGATRYAWWIPRAAWWHLFNGGYNDDMRALFEQSMRSVEKAGDRQGIAIVAEALRYGRRALLVSVESGDAGLTAIALNHIQRCKREAGLGSPAAADRYLAAALRLARLRGNRPVEAEVLNEKAIVLCRRGRHDEATALHEAAIAIIRQTSDRLYEVSFLLDLATTRGSAGDSVGALELYRRALRLARAHGMAYLAARAEAGVAECLAGADPEQARRHWRVALAAFREMGVPEQHGVERRLAA